MELIKFGIWIIIPICSDLFELILRSRGRAAYLSPLCISGLVWVRVSNLFENNLCRNDLPCSKGFMKLVRLFVQTRPKPAYGRQGLDWDRWARI